MSTFIAEPLGRSELLLQSLIKRIILEQLMESLYFQLFAGLELIEILELLPEEVPFVPIEHVHTLEADLAAVHLPQVLNKLAELPHLGDFGGDAHRPVGSTHLQL